MIKNPRPTRAEITDIANAIYYRTDALMLSGETAYGKYPVEAVQVMAKVAEEAEKTKLSENDIPIEISTNDLTSFLANAAVQASTKLGTKAIITDTYSGKTALHLAAYRGTNPVLSMKKKLLIANRSEIAIRIIRSAHKLGLTAVVFQSDKEPDALYLNYADEVIPAKDAINEKPVFLDAQLIVKLAKENGIDLIHPGYGFLSENPDFAKLCVDNGITFVGPSPELIRDMGIKTIAKKMALEAGLPLVPGSDGPVTDAGEAREYAEKIGYPVILKAAAGGGGRGMTRRGKCRAK